MVGVGVSSAPTREEFTRWAGLHLLRGRGVREGAALRLRVRGDVADGR